MMVYDFETAAYNTAVDEISMPIRTKFGYHLIQVNDKRKAVGNVKVAHIMFKTAKDANENQINEAYQTLGDEQKKRNPLRRYPYKVPCTCKSHPHSHLKHVWDRATLGGATTRCSSRFGPPHPACTGTGRRGIRGPTRRSRGRGRARRRRRRRGSRGCGASAARGARAAGRRATRRRPRTARGAACAASGTTSRAAPRRRRARRSARGRSAGARAAARIAPAARRGAARRRATPCSR